MIQILGLIPLCLSRPVDDPVAFSFAAFGCNRLETEDWTGHERENPSSANLPQLKQNILDVQSISPKPSFLLAMGDLVMNYAPDDGSALRSQLDGWATQVKSLAKIPIIPIAGNHELNQKKGKNKVPNLATDRIWNEWLERSGFARFEGNGPTPHWQENPDRLIDDQSRLSYSFDQLGNRFIVINTDTRTSEIDPKTQATKVAWIPVNWVIAQLRESESNPQIKNVFLIGHRNLFDPLETNKGSQIDESRAAQLLAEIPKCSKFRAYVCAHLHAWDLSIIPGTSAWQIVAGNGGSPPEDSWHPKRGYTYGFAVVQVHRSGAVGVVGYHRAASPEALKGADVGVSPAKPDPEVMIYQPKVR